MDNNEEVHRGSQIIAKNNEEVHQGSQIIAKNKADLTGSIAKSIWKIWCLSNVKG
jgi:hypothetical protein